MCLCEGVNEGVREEEEEEEERERDREREQGRGRERWNKKGRRER